MSSIIENLNEIVSTKNEIKGIINDNGLNAGEVFSDYPDMLRTIISTSGGGASGDEIISYISSYLGAYNYIDQTKLSANSYVTSADIPTIDEDIIPKETDSYTLGSSSYKYLSTYSSNIYTRDVCKIHSTSNYNLLFYINGNNRFTMDTLNFTPGGNGTHNLGGANNKWAYTYTNYLILNGTDIKTSINGMFSYDSTTGVLTINTLT
jgi:hypothetical protein